MALRALSGIARAATRQARAYRRDKKGVTLVEFAVIAPLFFLLLLSIIEIALISLSTSTFRTGLSHASRLVRTGDAQCLSRQDFIVAICSRTSLAPNCAERTEIDRQVYSVGFSSDPELVIGVDEFAALSGGDVVRISATYEWEVLSPIVAPFLADGSGVFPYEVSFLFKNEEFPAAACL